MEDTQSTRPSQANPNSADPTVFRVVGRSQGMGEPKAQSDPAPVRQGQLAFAHSGDKGDLVYALPGMRSKAKLLGFERFGLLLTVPHPLSTNRPRETFTATTSASMSMLLNRQPYVSSCVFLEQAWTHIEKSGLQEVPQYIIDCDGFRPLLLKRFRPGDTISDHVCDMLGVSRECSHSKWLDVDPIEVADVVICKTARYSNPEFPWRRVMQKYRPNAVFVGLESEWKDFVSRYGPIPFIPTATILGLAQLIAGCRLFVGNQSLALAIAEGLKKPVVMEQWPRLPDTYWPRTNAWGWLYSSGHLPSLEEIS